MVNCSVTNCCVLKCCQWLSATLVSSRNKIPTYPESVRFGNIFPFMICMLVRLAGFDPRACFCMGPLLLSVFLIQTAVRVSSFQIKESSLLNKIFCSVDFEGP